MKKIAKLSLVAAVAVAGLTNVNAASLEEAIKGVDVSGQFRFRVQDKQFDTAGVKSSTAANDTDVEIEVGVKVPVTGQVTAVFKIDNASNKSDSDTSKDGIDIEDYYFSYADSGLTVNFGQQNIPGRLTDGKQGDGIVALYNLGAFTVGAAAFMNHNVATVNGKDAYSVIGMGNVGPVSLLAQYVDVEDVLNAYNVKADASIEMVKIGAEYSETELDSGATKDDRSTLKAYAAAKLGILSAKVTYAATGDNGSGTVDNQTETQTETPAEFLLWNVGTAGKAEMDLYAIDASVKVTDKITLRAAYADGEYGPTDTDIKETLGQVSYKVAKNLNTYLRYADVEDGTTETQRGRIEVKYSF